MELDKIYMLTPAVLNPLIPFLSSIEYGCLLCTCKEIRDNYDYGTEWKRRSPEVRHHKVHSFIKEKVCKLGPLPVLNEVTNKISLKLMMRSYRSILHTVDLLKVYEEYLQNGECIDRRRIDLERYRLRKIICKARAPTNRDPYRRLRIRYLLGRRNTRSVLPF